MVYSIGDIAERMGISTSAIRFYDRKGLLPFVERDSAGRRKFKENDLNFIEVIECLKKSGVPVDDIAHFIDLCIQGDSTLKERYSFLDQEEQQLQNKIDELQKQLDFLRFKKWYYKTSVQAGTEAIHFKSGTNLVDPDTYNQYKKALEKSNDIRKLIDLND